ncbi:MAG: Fe-S protein assembly co-chaperone HscB [Candidatus Rokubacteria bacterium]|nr:Fe-S protein assembly co-chaperone HscB [Candidatus Rokubacteria bacterium]
MNDYFAVFGLPRKLRLDPEELRRRFYELSRVHHPDFHQGASEEAQARALSASALVNRAYRALRDPLGRVEYLVALEEGREGDEARPRAPMDLLEEMLEVQEALQEARAAGLDEASRQRLDAERQRLIARRASEEEAIAARAPAWDAAVDGQGDRRGLLDWFKQRLAARAYLGTVIEDLSDALGEEEEGHVSHRRH